MGPGVDHRLAVLGALPLARPATGAVVPTITGSATVTGEARLFFTAEEWQGSPVV